MDKPEQPTPAQLMEASVVSQESWLLLAGSCHKSDQQETIECLVAAVGEILSKMGQSGAFVQSTQIMLSRLMEICYDTSPETTLNNMRDAFAQVNARIPAALEERQRMQETRD